MARDKISKQKAFNSLSSFYQQINMFYDYGGKPAIRTHWWECINLHASQRLYRFKTTFLWGYLCHKICSYSVVKTLINKERSYISVVRANCVRNASINNKYRFMHLFIRVNDISTRAVHHAQDVVDHIYGILLTNLKFLRTLQVFFWREQYQKRVVCMQQRVRV